MYIGLGPQKSGVLSEKCVCIGIAYTQVLPCFPEPYVIKLLLMFNCIIYSPELVFQILLLRLIT